jgi:hypothetical protein
MCGFNSFSVVHTCCTVVPKHGLRYPKIDNRIRRKSQNPNSRPPGRLSCQTNVGHAKFLGKRPHGSRPDFFVQFGASQADSCLAHQSFLSLGGAAAVIRFCCRFNCGHTLQSKKGPRTPSAIRAAGNQTRGFRGLPELFASEVPFCITLKSCAQGFSEPCGRVSLLSALRRAFGWRLLEGPSRYRPTSDEAWVRRHSCRPSSTTCTAGSAGNPPASPPSSPDDQVA